MKSWVKGSTSIALLIGVLVLSSGCTLGPDIRQNDALDLSRPLVLVDQGSFFVGGVLEKTDAMTGTPGGFVGYSNTDDIKVDQMYVQFEVPTDSAHKIPFVMIHGCCLTAKTWEDTPDGRMGWYEYFVRNHHTVYLPDQSSRARSGFDATSINEVRLGLKPASTLPNIITFGRQAAWDLFRFGPKYPTPWNDEQFPVEAMSDFGNQVVPDINSTLPTPNPTYENLAQLAILAGGAVVMGHSESGFFPEYAALANSTGIKGIVTIETICPALDEAQIQTLAKIPTLVIFGDHLSGEGISGSRWWTSRLAACQTFVDRLKAAGGNAELLQLPQIGLYGNSHMLMQDKNNLRIADYILAWSNKNVSQEHGKRMLGKNRNASDE